MSELVLYTSADGTTRLDLRVDGHTVWLTQLEIAELFQTTKQNVSLHARNIFEEGELPPMETQSFFAEVQNKLLFAAAGKTAAELIVARANPDVPNMALTLWTGSRARMQDVIIAKNYLTADEVDSTVSSSSSSNRPNSASKTTGPHPELHSGVYPTAVRKRACKSFSNEQYLGSSSALPSGSPSL